MSDFEVLLDKARAFHGDVCPGIVLGTRTTMAGMRELGLSPFEKNRGLIVYVEIDRCMADAIQAITGCSLGHRSLKCMNYGKFAATFVDTKTGNAVRIAVIDKDRQGPEKSGKGEKGGMKDAVKTLSEVPEKDLLIIRKVRVEIPDGDMPGMPKHRETCSVCGEKILDSKEMNVACKPVCKNCANGSYYTILADGE